MEFALSDEQELLQESVRGALARAGDLRLARQPGGSAVLAALWREQGWAGIGVPEAAGGQGGGALERALLVAELARVAAPWPVPAIDLAIAAAAHATTDVAAGIVAGEQTAVLCVPAEARLEATVAMTGGTTVSGEIGGVLGAADADLLLVPVGARDVVVVDAAAAQIRARPLVDPSRRLADVRLDAAPARPLGVSEPERLLAGLTARAHALVAADALGAAERLLEMTVAYVAERQQFGRPIGAFQAVKHTAADMLVDLECARSAVLYGAWALDAAPLDAPQHAATAKWLACEAAARIADRALALHGAIGFTWEHDLHLLFKRIRADLRLYGAPATHRAGIAVALRRAELAAA